MNGAHFATRILGLSVVLISGCVCQSHSPESAAPRPTSPSTVSAPAQPATPPEPLYVPRHPASQALTFQQIVARLQNLHYLPLTQAFVVHAHGRTTYHPFFLWPVPRELQKAADAQPWNAHNPFIRGALIQFERANGSLFPAGVSEGWFHHKVVQQLFSPKVRTDPYPWQWVLVNKARGTDIPESLHLWRHSQFPGFLKEGRWIFHSRVNTGVLGSTPDGTWPIYQRLPSTTMQGVFPIPISWARYHTLAGQQVPQWAGSRLLQSARGLVDGHPVRWQPYRDPGVLWVNYFDNGRGIHYYPRASYGFPQSAGCVEEPFRSAPVAYHLLHYGVPVTISAARY